MKAILKREFAAYFKSPLGYVFLGLFFAFASFAFMVINVMSATTSMTRFFVLLCYVFIFAIPILTMKMFSEERKLKTDQLLLTSPVKVSEIVFGKFVAAIAVLGIGILGTVLYLPFMKIYGNPAVVQSLIGYLGIFLYGAMLISIGMFVSSLTQSQVIAAVVTLAVVGIFSFAGNFAVDFTLLFQGKLFFLGKSLNALFALIAMNKHFYDFAAGTLNLVPLFYFLSVTGLFVFLTVRTIEKRRWK